MTAKSRKAQIAGLSEFTRTQKEASRRRLLEAARRVFNRHGYLAPSVDDIAQEAGVSRQTCYRHFDGKLAIAMEYFDRQNEFALPLWTRIAHENFTDPMVVSAWITALFDHFVFERFESHAKGFSSAQMIRDNTSTRLAFAGGEPNRPIAPKLSDLQDRKQWMDKNGIDHQLVGGWLDSFGYELPAAEGAAWSRYLNHCLLDALDDEPRFTPLATVPLQDGALAAEVLKEAWEQGFGGVMIGTLPKGSSGVLDAPELDLFWAQADALGAAVFLHPMFLCVEPRLSDYDLVNALGRVADTSIAVSRLLYSGHLLRYPNLKLVLSHGGAALLFVLGRLSRNFTIAQGKYADPRKGFAALYFDSVVFDQAALRLLVEVAGDGRVMLGSDMPFPIGDPHPRAVIEYGSCFSEPQRCRRRPADRCWAGDPH